MRSAIESTNQQWIYQLTRPPDLRMVTGGEPSASSKTMLDKGMGTRSAGRITGGQRRRLRMVTKRVVVVGGGAAGLGTSYTSQSGQPLALRCSPAPTAECRRLRLLRVHPA